MPFTVSNFDLPGPRYAVAKAQNGNSGDGSRAVWPAKKLFPPETITTVAWGWAQKKITFHPLWPKLWGFKVKSTKNGAKVPNFGADLGVGSSFGPLRGLKWSKSKNFFFPRTMTLLA